MASDILSILREERKTLAQVCCSLCNSGLVASVRYCPPSVDSPSISLGDQARMAEGVLNEKSSVLVFRVTSLVEMI